MKQNTVLYNIMPRVCIINDSQLLPDEHLGQHLLKRLSYSHFYFLLLSYSHLCVFLGQIVEEAILISTVN